MGSTSRGHGSPKFLIKFSINCVIPLVFNQISRVFLTLWLVNLSYMILCSDLTVSDSVYTYNIIAMYKLRKTVQKILHWFCDNTRMLKFLNLMSDEHVYIWMCCLFLIQYSQSTVFTLEKKIKILNKTPWIKIKNYRLR